MSDVLITKMMLDYEWDEPDLVYVAVNILEMARKGYLFGLTLGRFDRYILVSNTDIELTKGEYAEIAAIISDLEDTNTTSRSIMLNCGYDALVTLGGDT